MQFLNSRPVPDKSCRIAKAAGDARKPEARGFRLIDVMPRDVAAGTHVVESRDVQNDLQNFYGFDPEVKDSN